MLSEEAQEARNKDLRNYRLYHSRKKGRIESNEDVMHNLLLSSDPFINSFRTKLKLKKLELPDEVKQLLKEWNAINFLFLYINVVWKVGVTMGGV